MRLALALVLLTCTQSTPPEPAAELPQRSGRAGVSLVRDWVREEVTAQPAPGGWSQADRRYCRLAGCTYTGTVNGVRFYVPGALAGQVAFGTSSTLGIAFNPGSGDVQFVSSSAEQWRVDGTTGNLISSPGRAISTTGIGNLGRLIASDYAQSTGEAAATLQARSPTGGAFEWDTTNVRMREYEGSSVGWTNIITSNPDAGAPYGPVFELGGYNPLTAAATTAVKKQRVYPIVRPLRTSATVTAPGTGAGTATVTVVDVTSSTTLCTSGTFGCTTSAGGTSSSDCSPYTSTGAVGHDVEVRIVCTGCTTCPLGNISALLQVQQ